MRDKGKNEVVLRPKRQLTLPREICEELGIGPGDRLELALEGSALVARPKRSVALEALREIQAAFQRSGIAAAELQATGARARRQVARERYGAKG
ncbi:MAG: AbrB/MazE/SpoVT family DNA-binding domain-containing protein [Chloroflexi bacterium]|nr:AbrB/MazE/SpoVT family DNA-binding domain-containing protein [Chloroflexota bacterium]